MSIPDYEYRVEQCDIPAVRQPALSEYRTFRRKCLEYMRGNASTSVMNQVHDLAWHTAVFRTLNEARRLESQKLVNGAMWQLITEGYASLMTLGIRRLVDKDPRTNSVSNVIAFVERRSELARGQCPSYYTRLSTGSPVTRRSESVLIGSSPRSWCNSGNV